MSKPVELVEALSYESLETGSTPATGVDQQREGRMHTSGERLHDGEIVRRTLCIKRTIEGFKGKWFGVTMVANRTGLPKGTVHRYLAIFLDEGYLERNLHHPEYREKEEE